jgi:hypothetical protein
MISIALALGIATAPTAVPAAAFYPCAPNKHTACVQPAAAPKGAHAIPAGKRCHPDSTRSFGCVERLVTKAERDRVAKAEQR